MIDQMNPDASVKALASTEVDVSSLTPGNTLTVLWRGKPVFIRRRTKEEIDEARKVKMEDLIHPEKELNVLLYYKVAKAKTIGIVIFCLTVKALMQQQKN